MSRKLTIDELRARAARVIGSPAQDDTSKVKKLEDDLKKLKDAYKLTEKSLQQEISGLNSLNERLTEDLDAAKKDKDEAWETVRMLFTKLDELEEQKKLKEL